jgi:hypothetical protein
MASSNRRRLSYSASPTARYMPPYRWYRRLNAIQYCVRAKRTLADQFNPDQIRSSCDIATVGPLIAHTQLLNWIKTTTAQQFSPTLPVARAHPASPSLRSSSPAIPSAATTTCSLCWPTAPSGKRSRRASRPSRPSLSRVRQTRPRACVLLCVAAPLLSGSSPQPLLHHRFHVPRLLRRFAHEHDRQRLMLL